MAWWLLDSVINGTLETDYPIKENDMSDEIKLDGADEPKKEFNVSYDGLKQETSYYDYAESVDHLVDTMPSAFTTLSDNDDSIAHHISTPSIEKTQIRKYEEDKGIKDLQDYISTTYGGHYTSQNNNVQTLDLIESVGDAEAFCRSNAIKYLSRYDKKGQAKRDILKALHYTLLLYYFSGHTQIDETPTRGYETF